MPQKNSLKSLEARMDAQLQEFGYGPSEHEFGSTLNMVQRKMQPEDEAERAAYHEKWNGRRKVAAGTIGAASLAGLGYAKRNEIKRGVRVGAYKGAEALGDVSARLTKSSGLWGKNPQKGLGGFLKNTAATGAAVGSRGLRKVSRMLSAEDMDSIVELAERVAMIELAAEDEIEFGRMDDLRDKVKGYAGQAKATAEELYGKGRGYAKRGKDMAREQYGKAASQGKAAYGKVSGQAKAAYGKASGGARDIYAKARKAGLNAGAGAGARVADGVALLKKYPGRAGAIGGGVAALAGAGAYGAHRRNKAKRRDELLARFKGA